MPAVAYLATAADRWHSHRCPTSENDQLPLEIDSIWLFLQLRFGQCSVPMGMEVGSKDTLIKAAILGGRRIPGTIFAILGLYLTGTCQNLLSVYVPENVNCGHWVHLTG